MLDARAGRRAGRAEVSVERLEGTVQRLAGAHWKVKPAEITTGTVEESETSGECLCAARQSRKALGSPDVPTPALSKRARTSSSVKLQLVMRKKPPGLTRGASLSG